MTILSLFHPYKRDEHRTFNPVTTVLDKMGVSYIELLGTRSRPKQSRLGKESDLKLTIRSILKKI